MNIDLSIDIDISIGDVEKYKKMFDEVIEILKNNDVKLNYSMAIEPISNHWNYNSNYCQCTLMNEN